EDFMAPSIDPRAIPELSPEEKRLQRILKGVVIGLAVLILIVLGLIVVKMVGGGKKKTPPPVSVEQTMSAGQTGLQAGTAVGVRDVVLPPGSQLAETTIGAGTLALRARGADGTETLIVLGLASGAERGRFVLKAAR